MRRVPAFSEAELLMNHYSLMLFASVKTFFPITLRARPGDSTLASEPSYDSPGQGFVPLTRGLEGIDSQPAVRGILRHRGESHRHPIPCSVFHRTARGRTPHIPVSLILPRWLLAPAHQIMCCSIFKIKNFPLAVWTSRPMLSTAQTPSSPQRQLRDRQAE